MVNIESIPLLLCLACLLPLGSFAIVALFGQWLRRWSILAGWLATGAILGSFLLSALALTGWLAAHPIAAGPAAALSGDWYTLGEFGSLRITIGYYVDALTLAMFLMVTLVATCIHVYSFGYMHEELGDVTDPLAPTADGRPLVRRGRFHRFYQHFSLFCFSMLGLVLAGNLAMVFMFWELVGICSYLLIGFYFERQSASNAANKAFIVNRVGDFGMLIGMMAIWSALGTFSFGDLKDDLGHVSRPGIFSQVRPADKQHALTVPDRMVVQSARTEIDQILNTADNLHAAGDQIRARLPEWRKQGYGYWLLVVGGLGIFCGCVGKSAQFPLHVWLPDAMEGPTPVSALIHAATMVAAGVYLVGRFYPVFTPEVLLVIACVGCITLFMAATIAIVATDIKRVLAYSTISQLGYMMLGLGLGGWVAGLFHLLTHAFFKSLLFLCSGSVIHATGTNEMPEMGGLLKKMPWTAYTMLAGCLAISGAGIPLLIGLSGYYSKDSILAQAFAFKNLHPMHGWLFYAAALGAAITAFYMFRLWYMTFLGKPRREEIHGHAHESPRVMVLPLVVLATLAVIAGWPEPISHFSLSSLVEQARPLGTEAGTAAGQLMPDVSMPAEPEKLHYADAVHVPVSMIAFLAGLSGFVLATLLYCFGTLDPEDARKTFAPIHCFLQHKWWFDELYDRLLVRPVLCVCGWVARFDSQGIDWLVDGLARSTRAVARLDDWIDRVFVDGLVDGAARTMYNVGLLLRRVQTGKLRQYVMFLAVATVTLFILVSWYWNYAVGG